jgi:hypothetical protein
MNQDMQRAAGICYENMKKGRLEKPSDIGYGVSKLRLRNFTGTYQNLLNS